MIFFSKSNKISLYLLAPFILQNFKTILRADLMKIYHFLAQNGPFVLSKIFFIRTIIITFIYLLAIFIVQNFKKFSQQI